MKKIRLSSAILSIVAAAALWLFVVTNVSQEDDRTFYNVPVVLGGETILSERSLMVTNSSTRTVSLNLTGPRSELNKISSGSNLAVRVDLTNINEPGGYSLSYTVIYPADVTASSLAVQSRSPGSIYFEFDHRRTKEIPVQIKWTGARNENYLYDTENVLMDYPAVTVIGPAAVVDTIECATVEVDLTGRVESFEESFRYTLCDGEGMPVNAANVTTNAEEVRLEMPIRLLKDMPLGVNVNYGGAATVENTEITITPPIIRVSGSETLLAELGDSLVIGSVNLSDLTGQTNELVFPITLPEGVTNQTGVSEATVTVKFKKLMTREFQVDTFRIWNVPEGLDAEIITESLTVLIRGDVTQLTEMTDEDVWCEVDFSNAEQGTATYRALIHVSDRFDKIGVLKSYSVSARLHEDTEETVPQTQPQTVPEEVIE